MATVLQTSDLTKTFGNYKAVDQLNLTVEQGQIFGLLGPNGSGKTTTLGMALGVVNPTSGKLEWFNSPPNKWVRRRIGAILEHPIFYPHLSATENLKIACEIKEAPKKNIEHVLKFTSLDKVAGRAFKNFSLGMKQRLSIASALLNDPDVLILDEPTNGLDPEGIASIRELIISIAQQGKTIVLASHLLDEVQKICSHYAVLKTGQVRYQGNVQIDLNSSNHWILHTESNGLKEALLAMPQVVIGEEKPDGIVIQLSEGLTPGIINEECHKKGIILDRIEPKKNSLEEKFLEILKS